MNRVYLDPNFKLYPSIYGAKAIMVYHHIHNRIYINKESASAKNREESKVSNDIFILFLYIFKITWCVCKSKRVEINYV